MRDEAKKLNTFSRRTFLFNSLQFIMFATISGRMIQLQLIEAAKYKLMSEKNRTRLAMIPPIRGIIYDRHRKLIATHTNYSRLSYDSRDAEHILSIIKELNTQVLNNPIAFSEKEIKDLLKSTPANSPIVLSNNLTWDDLAKLAFHRYKFEKLVIEDTQRRFYPYGAACCHVLGYIAPPNEKNLKNSNIPNYRDFPIGKNGIEKTFEDKLQGIPGFDEAEVNVKGIVIRKISTKPSIAGDAIETSIDIDLQQEVAKNFIGKVGSCVILNMRGEVLAMHSSPSFDPNQFVVGISKESWQTLRNHPERPMLNRAISSTFPPGSTFKIITALAGLMQGIDPHHKVFCSGAHKVGNRIFHCAKRDGHGAVDLEMALAKSCNVYFYKAAMQAGVSAIAKAAKILGLGNSTGIELPSEANGNVPDIMWKLMKRRERWSMGDTANTAIGQGYLLVTPLQLAVMIARTASGLQINPTIQLQTKELKPIPMISEYLKIIRNGLYTAVNGSLENYDDHSAFLLAGKTGTAQVASLANSRGREHLNEHGLFVGFAPYDNPQYAISCIVEHGGWGSASALPLAKQISLYLARRQA